MSDDDRKAYDQLVLDTVYAIKNDVDKIRTTVTDVSTRLTVMETKALVYGGISGFIISILTTMAFAYFKIK